MVSKELAVQVHKTIYGRLIRTLSRDPTGCQIKKVSRGGV